MGFTLFPNQLSQWKVVLVSFATATTFWFFNSLNQTYDTNLNYPILFEYNRDSLVSVKQLPGDVELDVSGGGWSLLRKTAIFSPEPLIIKLDNPVSLTTLSWLELLPSIREQIQDLNINQVLEDTLNVQIEPIRSKWVYPNIDSLSISLENGYRVVSSITIQQDSIEIIGPRSYIDTLPSSLTVQMTDEEIDDDFSGKVRVLSDNSPIIRSRPQQIDVGFDVERFIQVAIEIPVEQVNFPEDSLVRLSRDRVEVNYHIKESVEEEFSMNDFIVMADFNMFRPSDSSVLVMLTGYPSQVVDISIYPEVIKVQYND